MAEYLSKTTKGMFQHTSNVAEINAGVYLNLHAKYRWIDNATLDLKVYWGAYTYNATTKKGEQYTIVSDDFKSNGTLYINGQSKASDTLDGNILSNPRFEGTIQNLENVKTVNISFQYQNGNAKVDLTQDFNILKIPKPSKYDNNVVFNQAGLNEMIDYFKKYPITSTTASNKYGHIQITQGVNSPINIGIKGFEESTSSSLLVNTNLIPDETELRSLGTNNKKWNNIYSKDGIFSNQITADKFKGLFIGNSSTAPTALEGNSININDNFIVRSDGSVSMKGNITWGNDNAFAIAYHKGRLVNNTHDTPNPDRPIDSDGNCIQASEIPPEDSSISPRWHKTLDDDWFMSMTFNGGKSWTPATRINAQDGATGTVENKDVLDALRAITEDGLYDFPYIDSNGKVVGRLGIKATALQTALATIGVLEMGIGKVSGDANGITDGVYNATNNTTLSGGYITFPIPAPFTVSTVPDNANSSAVNKKKTITIYNADGTTTNKEVTVPELINQKGWRGRMGYLRGNGNGIIYNGKMRNTAGMGIAVYTNATFDDFYDVDKVWLGGDLPQTTINSVVKKTHLVLSLLMLTDSGLGLMTAVNQYSPDYWTFVDLLTQGSFSLTQEDEDLYEQQYQKDLTYWPGMILDQGRYPHYQYRWWSGSGEGSKIPRIARLWLHEDNGGLYYSYDYNDNDEHYISLTPWNWSGTGTD